MKMLMFVSSMYSSNPGHIQWGKDPNNCSLDCGWTMDWPVASVCSWIKGTCLDIWED